MRYTLHFRALDGSERYRGPGVTYETVMQQCLALFHYFDAGRMIFQAPCGEKLYAVRVVAEP